MCIDPYSREEETKKVIKIQIIRHVHLSLTSSNDQLSSLPDMATSRSRERETDRDGDKLAQITGCSTPVNFWRDFLHVDSKARFSSCLVTVTSDQELR